MKAPEKLLNEGVLPKDDDLGDGGLRKIGLAVVELASDALIDAGKDEEKVSASMRQIARALRVIAEKDALLASGLVTRLPFDGPPWVIDRLRRLAWEERDPDAVALVAKLSASPEALLRATQAAGL